MTIEQFNERLCNLLREAATSPIQPHEVIGSLELAKPTYIMPTYLRMEQDVQKQKKN